MAVTIDQIIDDVLKRELPPGVSQWNDPRNVATLHSADRGSWTRGGITVSSWGEFMGWNRQATRSELDGITETQARAFYVKRYVVPWQAYQQPLQTLLIDYGVTSGSLYPAKALQQALRDMKLYTGKIDGVIGPKTRAAVVAVADQRLLYLMTLEYRARHYIAIAFDANVRRFLRETPGTQLHNCRGWLARCLPFVYEAPL